MLGRRLDRVTGGFTKITVSPASPDEILSNSKGEVLHAETINYRSFKPEMDGLFCEKIFGPTKDWECHCGKYRRIRYRDIVCDRCGVEVTEKRVRRERMGHIKLVMPVAHIWYFRSLPSKIGHLLGFSIKKLDQVVYYERYMVIQPGVLGEKGLARGDFLTEEEYLEIVDSLPKENQYLEDNDSQKCLIKMGAEAIEMMLQRLDLDALSFSLRTEIREDFSQRRVQDLSKRLKIVESFRKAKNERSVRPEWMILRVLPVIPPELRPLIPLDGGKFASSDLNDLYRRVIIRNNRLRRLVEVKAPEIILRNEKRMLQEAVDSLFDNSRKANAVRADGNRSLKSLSDILKGKQGRFRQNLLGKRVDYSGRSVIVVGPELKMHECGLPKDMALELFKPFVVRKLMDRGIVKTVKAAKRVVEKKEAVVWDILENVLKGHPVLLNRAPTLHRLGIQAFQPKLIEGKAIQLHPLTCTAFNADFDGDQMAVHVPLSTKAILEASLLMLSSHNVLNPANGSPITVPSQDMVLGLYYLTKGRRSTPELPMRGESKAFFSAEEVIVAVNEGAIDKHAHIKLRTKVRHADGALKVEMVETVVGRVIFSQHVPEEMGFVNQLLTKKALQSIIGDMFKVVGLTRVAKFLDDIKELGFSVACAGGLSIGLDDISVPSIKQQLIREAKQEVEAVHQNYMMGLITDNERYNQVIDIWTRINSQLTRTLMEHLENEQQGFNSVYMMMHSGARGSREQIRQLGGMRGLMAKPRKSLQGEGGEIIENPILSNFKEGLDIIEYFISTHGARKGLADTALKTADAGYLTRRLVDVAQDVIILETDCGTLRGLVFTALKDNEEIVDTLASRVLGRVSVHDVYSPVTDELLVRANKEITEEVAQELDDAGVEEIEIRSALTCESRRGACARCYGRNLATGKMVQMGETVGVTAAQSIGEPGTQLTLRTFHVGGTASNIAVEASISSKFDGYVEFEDLKTVAISSSSNAKTRVVIGRTGEVKILDEKRERVLSFYHIPYGSFLRVKNKQKVAKGDELCHWDPYNAVILSTQRGEVRYHAIEEGITYQEEFDEQTGHREKVISESKDKTKNPSIHIYLAEKKLQEYNIPAGAHLMVEDGAAVLAGAIIAKIPRIASMSSDITGGLPRVTELFEARNPSNPAVVSEIDGFVRYGGITRGSQEIFVESKEQIKKRYLVPLSRHILVQDNDYVKAGHSLCDGPIAPSDILAINGPTAVQEYLLNGIQEVYRLQGVRINDKHMEVIVRQMMQKVEITDSGDTMFLVGQTVGKNIFHEDNNKILDKKVVEDAGNSEQLKVGAIVSARQLRDENSALKRQDLKEVVVRDAEPAISKVLLQGITRASLDTESFISAASFQETTKVLSEASSSAKTDFLMGLKENVIVGHLIPVGTGMQHIQKPIVGVQEDYERLAEEKRIGEAPRDKTPHEAPEEGLEEKVG